MRVLKPCIYWVFAYFQVVRELLLAEREGFEPSVGLTLRLISSQVHSTTLPPLRNDNSL